VGYEDAPYWGVLVSLLLYIFTIFAEICDRKKHVVTAGTKQWTRLKDLRFLCLENLKLRREVWWGISKTPETPSLV
jgi:hypothetical protein